MDTTYKSVDNDLPAYGAKELLVGIRSGSSAHMRAFIKRYFSLVKGAATDVLHDDQSSTDVAWDVFKAAIADIQDGDKITELEPWLLRLTQDELRQRGQSAKLVNTPPAEQAKCPTPSHATKKQTAHKTPLQKGNLLRIILIVVLSLIAVFLLWTILGLIAKTSLLPLPDMGYGWFNLHIFELF